MKPEAGREIRLGRRIVVPMLAAWLLAGCTTGGQVPQYSARPGYYAPQRSPYYVEPPAAYQPAPYYVEPPRRRYVAPVPAEPEIPDQAALVPTPPPVSRRVPAAPPSFEPADPCVGWWRVCHLWD
jgi:hypothetical protein